MVAMLATIALAPGAALAATAPMISMSWTPVTISVGETSDLLLAPFNPDESSTLHNIAFTDTLPAGLTIPNGTWVDGICTGTVTVTGNNHIAYSVTDLGPTWACPLHFTVTAVTAGTKVNSTGAITANGSGSNSATASLDVTEEAPPLISTAFGDDSIRLGASTSMSFTITNPNDNGGLSGVGFSDSLPAGLVIGNPNGLTGDCGGTVTAVAGGSSLDLADLALDTAQACTFSVNVKGTSSGTKFNSTSPITSTEGGTGTTTSASIVVDTPPTVAISFGAATIGVGDPISLTFTIGNPLFTGQTGIGVSDVLPAGLVVATPNGLGGDCGSTVTAPAGGTTISLAGLSLAGFVSCSFTVNVKATTSGTKVNSTDPITSTEGGTGIGATASITVTGSAAPDPTASPTPVPTGALPTPAPTSTQSGATPNGSNLWPMLLVALGVAILVIRRCPQRGRRPI
jgi:hypothetical protein